eukprot:350889-Chlamydomonas_euryale.AAC.2
MTMRSRVSVCNVCSMRASTAILPERSSHPTAMPPRPERPLSNTPGGNRSPTFCQHNTTCRYVSGGEDVRRGTRRARKRNLSIQRDWTGLSCMLDKPGLQSSPVQNWTGLDRIGLDWTGSDWTWLD